jgi:hypothetical protein
VIERIFKGQTDLETNLLDLSKHWKIKLWFDKVIQIRTIPHWTKPQKTEHGTTRTRINYKNAPEHTFSRFFKSNGQLCYAPSRGAKHGYPFEYLESITKYEPVIESASAEFKSYKQFASKFDPRFIDEPTIKDLWDSKSSQHGGKYMPSDFHRIGPQGKKVLADFLRLFKGLTVEGVCYFESSDKKYKYLSQQHQSHSGQGRDIKVSHTLGIGHVSYASEYHGCGNGRYGLLANEKEFLWLEDD